ncbi:MAG: ABC transporter substrate-binding protein, partial [Clostridia bacterium]|nr:ABC transporter substrate-binding protein [Clostridia bacterium]
MKRFVALTLSLVMMLSMFAGCSSKEETTTAAPSTEAGGTTADQTTVATTGEENVRTDFVYGTMSDIVGFDPPDCNDGYSSEMFQYVYDRLFQFDENGEIQPMLVESYEQPSDTEFIFKIHEGVKYHNGDELKAADVVWSLNRANQNPKSQANFETVVSIEEVGEYELKIVTEKPFVPLLLNLAHSQTSIMHRATVEAIEAGDGVFNETNMMGTGPMMVEYYKPNSELKFVRFDEYWQGPCRATSMLRKVIPEASSLTIALEAGEIDYINELNSVDIARVMENPDLKTVEMASANIAYMGLNTTKAPFDNKLVRQALQYASNKESIVEVLYEGYGVPCNSVFPTVGVAYNDELDAYAYDIEKAKELLAEAGYPDGFEFEVVVSADIRSRAAQILQQDYQSVGITINIELMDFGA